MRKFGPMTFKQGYTNKDESIRVFGPMVSHGDMDVRSLNVMGPIIVNGRLICGNVNANGPITVSDELITLNLKVNGPLRINGNITLQEGRINGPLNTNHSVEISEFLKINGPLTADSVIAKSLMINGKISTKGMIEASKEIIITVGANNSISSEGIKAPRIIIKKSLGSFIGRVFNLILRRSSMSLPIIDVPIETDKLILDGIKYSGLLKSAKVETLNGAKIIDLLPDKDKNESVTP